MLEHCLAMKSTHDAMLLRERIIDCFELASLPLYPELRKREILHFIIIGGRPTGVELAAEICELVHEHLLKLYPHLEGMVKVSVHDVADRMLGQFRKKLSKYAMERFRKRGVGVCLGRKILGFERGAMRVKGINGEGEEEVSFGVAVWCAGNKARELVENLGVRKAEEGMERVLTDECLRVLKPKGEGNGEVVVEEVYALGDAVDIDGMGLPPTAEVALQKAEWLANH